MPDPEFQTNLVTHLNRIANALEILAIAQVPAPNYKRGLAEYKKFNWGTINATVLNSDQYGAAKVEWNGRIFTRRNSVDKKKGSAIWFSTVLSGNVAEGNLKWGRLISFKDGAGEIEPLDDKLAPRPVAARAGTEA